MSPACACHRQTFRRRTKSHPSNQEQVGLESVHPDAVRRLASGKIFSMPASVAYSSSSPSCPPLPPLPPLPLPGHSKRACVGLIFDILVSVAMGTTRFAGATAASRVPSFVPVCLGADVGIYFKRSARGICQHRGVDGRMKFPS